MGHDEKPVPPIMARFAGPGPGTYLLPPTIGYEKADFSRLRNPAYSMRPHTGPRNTTKTPGPQYQLGNITRYGRSGVPAYSIKPQLTPITPFKRPGPGAHAPEKHKHVDYPRPPAYSIGARTPTRRIHPVPAPNAYTIPPYLGPKVPNKESAAAYSMGYVYKPITPFQRPGPAQYNPGSPSIVKTKPPQYSMGAVSKRHSLPPNPGPAGYNPMYNPGKKYPQYSFGIRHTEFSRPCITEEDNK